MENQNLFEYDYTLDAKDKVFLKDIINDETYNRLFCNRYVSFLNKGQCGNGGTTGFVDYALTHTKGCLILVPNRSIVMSKEKDYKNNKEISFVYGGCDGFDNEARIVIATYDQFPRLLETLTPAGYTKPDDIWKSEFWTGRTIIIDEYHKLVDDCGYRDICHKITELVKETDSGVVLMSATPHMGYIDLIRNIVTGREVITYDISYDQDHKRLIQVYDAKERDLKSILKKVKDTPRNDHICVFYNNVKGIEQIIDHIGDCDCEILCSETNKEDLGDYFSNSFNESKRLHFLTSAYFTGHDINIPIRQCIIIGSRESRNMCLGERDIKQMIGRFRKGVDGIHIFYLNKRTNMNDYRSVKDEYDRNTQYLKAMGENWKSTTETIKLKQDTIRLEDTLERFGYWSRKDSLIKRLEGYGFVVKDKKIGEFGKVDEKRKLSFKKAKQMIADGVNLTYDDNKYSHQIQEYMKEKGTDEMLRASRTAITDWYKIRKNIGKSDLDLLTPEDKFKILGMENFVIYRGTYLLACLKYLGIDCDYDQIPEKMNETLGCYACKWKADTKGRNAGDEYIVFRKTGNWGIPLKMGMQNSHSINNNIPVSGGIPQKRSIPHKLSYQTGIRGKNCYGKTILLKDAPYEYNSLKGIPLYDWVNEDKGNRLPGVKGGKDWGNIKKYNQTAISEMYRDTDKEYRHYKDSMEYIDCLIVDIDSGISFDDFKEKYKGYTWVSYPTINNIPSDNWKKFRVIVPLKERLRLSGEYCVMTLKMLRSMFCYYEDPDHQVTSYINQEDWMKRKNNGGEFYDIPQEIADDLMRSIKNSRELVKMEFDRDRADRNRKDYHRVCKTLEWAQEYFSSSFDLGDGERHKRLFVIKNNLNDSDRKQFESWLVEKYGSRYLSHWRSHKIL